MSEISATDSLTQRLAVGRLRGAGILDHNVLRRTHDRVALPARVQALDRLQRRVSSATPSTDGLPLVRVGRSIERDAASSTDPTIGTNVPATAGDRVAAASGPSVAASASFVGALAAPQTPSISRTRAFVARRVAGTPGLIAGESTTSGVLQHVKHSGDAPESRPSIATGAASTGTLQRTADVGTGRVTSPADRTTPTTNSLSPTSDAGPIPTVMRAASPGPVATTASRGGAAGGMSTSSPLPRVSAGNSARSAEPVVWRKTEGAVKGTLASAPLVDTTLTGRVSRAIAMDGQSSSASLPPVSAGAPSPVIWRKAATAAPLPMVTALPSTPTSPSLAAPSPQLVLRKPIVSTETSRGPSQPLSITTSTPQVVARTADHGSGTPHTGTSTYSHEWNIDWITEQVGRRLARRLEVERERLGVRPWR
jgi:hypothetical protein